MTLLFSADPSAATKETGRSLELHQVSLEEQMRGVHVQLQAGRKCNASLKQTKPFSPLSFKVKFVFEAFSRMRPGVVLMALHGKVKQMKRIQVKILSTVLCIHSVYKL
jgi:ATP-dependent RNA helicase DDX10/DBP4